MTKPPERGVFALDHDGECKESMKVYLGMLLLLLLLLFLCPLC